jgi:hypothetical protein
MSRRSVDVLQPYSKPLMQDYSQQPPPNSCARPASPSFNDTELTQQRRVNVGLDSGTLSQYHSKRGLQGNPQFQRVGSVDWFLFRRRGRAPID